MADAGRRFEGRTALVTGGASGIGRATVQRLVSEGAEVVVGDTDEAGLSALVDEMGDAVEARRCDVTSEGDVERLATTTVERFGGLQVAFVNAGIGSAQRLVDADLEQWRQVMDVNLTGAFLTIKHAARHMDDGGAIVATASLNSVQVGPGMGAYCASKAGLAMLVQVAALELGGRGIRVNAVGPGFVRTPLTEGAFDLPPIVEGYVENTPLGRHGNPEEIAGLVAYLASDEASYISGSLMLIDGAAHTMKYPDVAGILDDVLGGG